MGYFSRQQTDILEFYEEGLSPKSIARLTGAPMEIVLETIAEFESGDFDYEPNEPNDSFADAEALASAGFGTDEDYGYYGDE